MTKKKKSAMMEVRAKKAKDLDDEATRVRAEVMERINKMAALKKTTGRQEKELQELQKQCLQLGLQLGVDDDRQIDPSAEEAVMDDNQRVPLIAETQQKAELNDEEKEKRREEIRENIKKEMEKKEQVNSLIREKLASMDARRKRLQQIRKQLEKQEEQKEKLDTAIAQTGEGIPLTPETPRQSKEEEEMENKPVVPEEEAIEDDAPVTEKSLDDILANAKANLNNLTAMRERLEHIKETGGADLNEDDIELLERLETVELAGEEEEPSVKRPKTEASLIMSKETETGNEEKNDIESAVRASFHKVFQPETLSLQEDQIQLMNQARRSAIEEMIRKIDEKLPSASSSPITMSSVSQGSLSLSLLSLEPDELRELAAYLLRLADLQEQTPAK